MSKICLFFTALCFSVGVFAEPISLNVYAEEIFSSEWGAGPEIKQQFERAYPQCSLNLIPFDSRSSMLNRVRLEGSKTKADVLLGLDNHDMDAAGKTGLFAPHKVDLNKLSLPINWQNDIFLPYDFGQFAFIYDKTKLSNPPTSLQELIERQDLRIIYQDPRTSSVGRGLLIWVNSLYSAEQVPQVWKTLAQHTVTVGKGWSESYGAFLKGEADLVLSYNTSPLYHLLQEQKTQYAAVEPAEGGVLQVETAAKIAKERENPCAEPLLNFLLTPQAQKEISLKNVMLPVISGAVEPHYDELKARQMVAKVLDTSAITKAQLKQWIDVWQRSLVK